MTIANSQQSDNKLEKFSSEEWLTNQAVQNHKEGNLEEAITFYLEVIELEKYQPDWVYGNAITLMGQTNRVEEGLELGEKALVFHPESDEILRAIGISLRNANKKEKYIKYFQTAIEINDKQPEWLYRILINYFGQKDLNQSILYYEQSIKIIPDTFLIHYEMGQIFASCKQWGKAIYSYSYALSLKLQYAEIANQIPEIISNHNNSGKSFSQKLFDLGAAFQKESKWTEAMLVYCKAIQIDAEHSCWLINNLGDVLLKLECWEEAEVAYYRALELNSNHVWTYYNLGNVLVELHKLPDAVDAFRQAITLDPNHSWTYYNLGNVLVELHKSPDAVDAFRQAIALDPNHTWSYFKLGEALASIQKWDQAAAAYNQALILKPESLEIRQKIAILNFDKAQCYKEESKKILHSIIQENPYEISFQIKNLQVEPGDPRNFLEIGNTLVEKKQLNRAIYYYYLGLRINPDIFWVNKQLSENFGDSNNDEENKVDIWFDFYKILNEKVDIPDLYLRLINLLESQKPKLAIEFNQKFLDYKFTYAEIYFRLGNVFSQKKLSKESIEFYTKSIVLEPNRAWFHKCLGDSFIAISDFAQGITSYQKAVELEPSNQEFYKVLENTKFRQKQWKKVIEYCQNPKIKKSENSKKILILTSYPPYPPNTGGAIRMFEKIKYLGKRHHVVVASFVSDKEDYEIDQDLENYCDLAILVKVENPLKPRQQDEPQKIHWWTTKQMWKVLTELQKIDFDLVTFDFIYMAPYQKLFNYTFTILEEHNIESNLLMQHSNTESNALQEANLLKSYEDKAWPLFNLRTVVSEVDAIQMGSRCNVGKTIIVDNGVNIKEIDLIDNGQGQKLFYMGHMGYYPNVDAVCYFAQEILPLVLRFDPQLRLCIAGRSPQAEVQELTKNPNIDLIANPENMSDVAVECIMTVVPLRLGSGTRLKILHSMAMGLPVVSTSIGAEGLSVKEGENILVRDKPEEFASAIIKVITDRNLRRNLSINGRKLVETKYDWECIFSKYEKDVLSEYEKYTNKISK